MTGGSTIAELYDSTAGTFARTGDMLMSRGSHTATLLNDGTVLIAGGASSGGTTATTEIYDPATGTFQPGATMHEARFLRTATLLPDGGVVIIGGALLSDHIYIHALDSAEIYQ
jgi:hypothetical protein